VNVIDGDIATEGFGLSPSLYHDLSSRCSHLIHCAGNVKANLPRDQAWRIAVGSAENLLELASACHQNGQLQKIEVVSTMGVAGLATDHFTESRVDPNGAFHNSYEWAKAWAEQTFWKGVDAGLPITIHRPSMVVGHSNTGQVLSFQVFYYICEFLSGCRTRGILPDLCNATVDTIPVDSVARAITWSSTTAETSGEVLHLCSGPDHQLRVPELLQSVRDAYMQHGVSLPRIINLQPRFFKAFLSGAIFFATTRAKRRLRTLGFFLDYVSTKIAFENSKTRLLLDRGGINIPDPSTYLRPVLDYYLSHRA
jgi:thioester reductase-like protein